MSDPRVEAAAKAMYAVECCPNNWEDHPEQHQTFLEYASNVLAAADSVALEGAPESARKLVEWADDDVRETVRDGTFEPKDGETWAVVMEQAAATIATQAAEISRLREVAQAARRMLYLPADASMEDGAIADSALRDALAALEGKEPPT